MSRCIRGSHRAWTAFAVAAMVLLTGSAQAGWTQVKITASDGALGDNFGSAVAITSGRAVVGAPADDDTGASSGTSYLFNAFAGTQTFKLSADDASAGDRFGDSVAIDGSVVIVGADYDRTPGLYSGSAYVLDAATGDQQFKLVPDDTAATQYFGCSVAVSGNTAIIGADHDNEQADYAGAAYLFDVTTGTQLAKLTPDDPSQNHFFGQSVGISGDIAIVGAHGDDAEGNLTGAAYLFDVTTGDQLFKLTAGDAAAGDYFGWSVAIDGDRAVVGAYLDSDEGAGTGSAYLFDVTTGQQLFKFTANDAAADSQFGNSVSISGDRVLVGAPYDDSAGADSDAGAAYLFSVSHGWQITKLVASDAGVSDRFGYSVAVNDGKAIVGSYLDDDVAGNAGAAYLIDVPEPTSLVGWGLGAAMLMLARRRRG